MVSSKCWDTRNFHLTGSVVCIELMSQSQKAASQIVKSVSILHNTAFPILKPTMQNRSHILQASWHSEGWRSHREFPSDDPPSSSLSLTKCFSPYSVKYIRIQEQHTCTVWEFSKLNYSVAQALIGSLRSKAEPRHLFADSYEQDRVIALQPTAHFSYIKEANKLL